MNKTQYCINCFYSSDHPFGITFNSSGLCSGCQIHQEKNNLDWNFRFNLLKKLVKNYKLKKSNYYDCIVPVSGAGDSYFILYTVKKLGLNPLLVSYNKYYNTSVGIENLSNLRNIFNVDLIIKNINPEKVKKITRNTLINFGNINWHVLAGQSVFPVQIAERYKIPLIIWGAHQGVEQVGMYSHIHSVEMTRQYRKNHDLFGNEAEDLVNISNDLNEEDVFEYFYPSDHNINKIGIRGIYLGNYIPWDPKKQHEFMIKKFNYKTYNQNRTIDCYDNVDCFNYNNLHDLLKLYKHGYSKITDLVTREIRHGRITKNQGIKFIINNEKKKIKYLDLFCDWIGIDPKSIHFILNKFRNKNFWKKIDLDQWKFIGHSSKYSKLNLNKKINLNFISNSKIKNTKKYIIFGKGM